jgi:ABC-type nickel/cobalt efflux system permease component RcnA
MSAARPRSRRRFACWSAAVLTAVCALLLLPTAPASAHPLGNFTVNHYDGLVAAPGLLRIDHVEDLAEIPATQVQPQITRSGIGPWAAQRCAGAARAERVTADGRPAAVAVGSATAQLRPGQAGLHTLRVECRFTAPLPQGTSLALSFDSGAGTAASGPPGWREITARGDRMTLTSSDVPTESATGRLTRYPKDLLSSPAHTTAAALRMRPGGPAMAASDRPAAPAASVLPRGADRWTQALDALISRRALTPGFALLALAAAVVLGALHALAPGHGKTLMAAAAAGRGGATLRDVLPLAASVTVTHTLGVVALGLLIAAGSTATTSVIAWLGMAGGVLVAVTGTALIRRAWLNRRHPHGHQHPHPHQHGDPHGDEHPHPHQHGDTHGQDHGHKHAQAHEHGHSHPHSHGHSHSHGHGHGHGHSHGARAHTHPTAPTLRGTLLLGFTGGLVPSPSAVVVLVGASALGRAWFGVLLVLGYGAGLALTLTAAGFSVVKAGGWLARTLHSGAGRGARPARLVTRSAPLVSAFVVLALGAGLIARQASVVLS